MKIYTETIFNRYTVDIKVSKEVKRMNLIEKFRFKRIAKQFK